MKIQEFTRRSLLLAIGSSYDTILRDLNTHLRKEDCSLLQALILISLFFESTATAPASIGAVTPSRLAETLRASRGNVSHSLSSLEKRGLIQRRLSEADARSYFLQLRPAGRKLACRLIRVIDELEGFFEARLGRDGVDGAIQSFARLAETYREHRA
jgi:DNA-binding MarR family transcriptional regulator